MTVELRYYTDPACEWSWGAEPKLRRLMAFSAEHAAQGVHDVPDPYYGDAADFERVLDLVEAASDGLVAQLRATLA